jgi:hypothetical protein
MKNGIEKRGGETRRDRGISARSPEGEVDVKKIEKIDRKVARVLGDDLVEALKEFAEERGLAVPAQAEAAIRLLVGRALED